MIRVSFSDVSERDMDLLFLEEFVCSESFLRLFTDLVGIPAAQPWFRTVKTPSPTTVYESSSSKMSKIVDDTHCVFCYDDSVKTIHNSA